MNKSNVFAAEGRSIEDRAPQGRSNVCTAESKSADARSVVPLNENNSVVFQTYRKSEALQKATQRELDGYSQMNDSTKISYGRDLIEDKNYYVFAATAANCALGIMAKKNSDLRTEVKIKDNEINTFKHKFGELDLEAKKKLRDQALQLSFSLDKDPELGDAIQCACIEVEQLMTQKL